MGTNDEGLEDKTCAKGIQHTTERTRNHYLSSLYNVTTQDYAKETMFVFNKQTCQMDSVTRTKKLLNNFYTKYTVQPDLVTLKPLTANAEHV